MNLQISPQIVKNYPANNRGRFMPVIVPETGVVQLLSESDKQEILNFLSERPVHTVVMTSMIHDNGIENTRNRGNFYGYRNVRGDLEGVALIGHTTLVEVRTSDALTALALQTRKSETPVHVMMSDGGSIESFWHIYTGGMKEPRLVCSERLFEIKHPVAVGRHIPGLRPATEAELMPIAEAHAEVALQDSGVNPLEKDREGFLKRVLRRINQNRVWVIVDETGKLIFKADIVAETPEVAYLEGIYVEAGHRGTGIAPDCLSQLSRKLLDRVKYVCLLCNEDFTSAHRSYLKAGFKSKDSCVTIFA